MRPSSLVPLALGSVLLATTCIAASELVAVPEATPLVVRRYWTGNAWWLVAVLWSLALPALILSSTLAERLAAVTRRIGRYWYPSLALFIVGYLVIDFVIDLPLAYHLGFARPHAYGLSNQTFGAWLTDRGLWLGVTVVFGVAIGWVPMLLIRLSPRRWWLILAAIAPVLMAAVVLAAPIVLDPLFDDFGPMRDTTLERRILDLADRAGIEGSRVFEVAKSADTDALNAYVTGLGATKRIVLWDTIIAALDEDELLVVMGHEMGHYVLRHVMWGLVIATLLVTVGLGAVHLLATRLHRRFGARWRIEHLHDAGAIPILIICGNLVSVVLAPLGNAFSRHVEHEADRFTLELTHANHAAATGFVEMQATNLSLPRPGPIFTLLRSTHPSIGDRIDFFNAYRPWDTDEPQRYLDRFTPPPGDP